jgi:hypothetical protein
MAKYPSISQTKNGRILIAKSNATGKALVPIKVVTGDGQLTNQNIETMENVINPLLELPFASPGRFVKEGQFQLDFALSNEHLEHGFYAREIGVFAKLAGEDDSAAVMIAYTNGGNFVDYIPAKDTPINSKVFEVTIAVDNAASVVVQRSDAAYITAGEMERHNTDANAHGGLLQNLKTQLSTHNTDISSHPAITAMIAKILGATNWQENPVATLKDIKNLLGMGGIVAQRLEDNGFVKFANGFTIQWGVSGEDGQYHNWIIPYSTCFFAKAEYKNPRDADWDLITEYDQLKFKVWFTNDTVFKYPNIKCSVFSFGVSA